MRGASVEDERQRRDEEEHQRFVTEQGPLLRKRAEEARQSVEEAIQRDKWERQLKSACSGPSTTSQPTTTGKSTAPATPRVQIDDDRPYTGSLLHRP
jgi:hypothetical protein